MPNIAQGAAFDGLTELLKTRRSVRGFLAEQVPHETIERILAAAQCTPSWCNTQPWQVHIVSGDATTQLVADLGESDDWAGPDFAFPPGYGGVYQERRRESGWQLYEAVGVARGDREASGREMLRNFEFFGAPHVAFVTTEASLGVYGAIDCGLYVQSFLLAATALGIGTCAQAAMAQRANYLRHWLGLRESRLVVCAIAFGYADPAHPSAQFRTNRAPLAEVVSWHTGKAAQI